MSDKWFDLRQQCFGNVEPFVELTTLTEPKKETWFNTECIPAISAGISYGKEDLSVDKCKPLNKKLIKMNHGTPLESVTFGFFIEGISKACGAQLSRHRVGQGHISLSRRYTKQKPKFVYPLFDYVEDKTEVASLYTQLSIFCENSLTHYNRLLDVGIKKQDARLFMPVNISTQRHWWVNARALRNLFELRLSPDAEWEIRRLAHILLDIVFEETPSLFEDIHDKYTL